MSWEKVIALLICFADAWVIPLFSLKEPGELFALDASLNAKLG